MTQGNWTIWRDEEPTAGKPSALRRSTGLGFAVLTVLLVAGFGLGAWNPWHLVHLSAYFGNPAAGVVWILAGALVAVWLLFPIANEAAHNRRIMVRVVLGAVLVLSLGFYGIFGSNFSSGEHSIVARSADHQRSLVLVTRFGDHHLRVWAGNGLGTRDAGYLGLACGQVSGRFEGHDRVHVSSVYGDFDLRLDPRTGRPLDTIGPTCSG